MLIRLAQSAAVVRDLLNGRMPTDGGPIYAETNPACCPVEPWSAASGIAFVLVAAWWLWRIRGQYRDYMLLSAGLPLMLIGGVGCMLYHGLRVSRVFLLMDAMPLPVLCLLAAAWAWRRVTPRWWHTVLLGCVAVVALLRMGNSVFALQVQITAAYGMLFVVILLPVLLLLVRSRGSGVGWVVGAILLAMFALATRLLDSVRPPMLPMGTHWLTHVFGAAGAFCLVAFIHREIRADLQRAPAALPVSAAAESTEMAEPTEPTESSATA